jgi:streptogrisin C
MRLLLAALLLLLGAAPAAAAPAPLGGGSLLFNSSYRCTAAFAATQGTTGYLIAGPLCGPAGTQLFSGNNVLVGMVGSTMISGGASVVRVTNPGAWTLVPWIPVGGGQYVIAGGTEAPVGGSVCLIDRALGPRCGVITAKNQTVTFPEGAITGLTRTNICMSAGGAVAFVSGDQAQGVPMGGSSCSTSGVSYFMPVRRILSAYGLTLLTG